MAELDGALVEAAQTAAEALDNLLRPLTRLGKRLEAVLEDAPDWLDGAARARIEGALGSLGGRCDMVAGGVWLLPRGGGLADTDIVEWLARDRLAGREDDSGIHRQWIGPRRPVREAVRERAHGVTSISDRANPRR